MTTTLMKSKKAFGVELEAAANTAETIEAGDCFRAINPEITVNDNPQENEGARTTRGKTKSIPGGKTADVSFGFWLKGSGTAGTTPTAPIDDIMKACGFAVYNRAGISNNYLLADTDSSITCQTYEGNMVGSTGKSKKARGVKGNLSMTLEPGKAVMAQFEGSGVFSSRTDATVLAASGEDTTDPPVMVSNAMDFGVVHTESVFVNDGTQEVMKDGAASNQKYAMSWTQSGAATVIGYAVKMQKIGVPANETAGLTIRIETDAAGDPSGTPVSNTTVTRLTTAIAAADQWEFFTLNRGSRGTVADATPYHLVFSGDWDDDIAATLKLDVQTVAAGSQKCKFYDAAWAALPLKNLTVVIITCPSGGDDIFLGPVEINLNNEVVVTPDDPNDAEGHHCADLVNADPTITLTPRDALDSEFDFAELIDDQDELFYQATIGSTSGNIIEITAMRLVAIEQADEDRGTVMAKSLTCRLDRELTEASLHVRYK